MEPIKLTLENFCSHSNTYIDFTNLQSALIVGKLRNNERNSNGAGKSSLLNAIEYALFNEIKFSTLERVIRDGCDIARVSFEFKSFFDNEIYKIVRSTSRKSGSDIRLFKKNGIDWDDITQRRIGDNEKEIAKLIKVNYKSFCSAFSFSQQGGESNTQKDFSNIATLTPEKRKNVLKEALQLTVYGNYEKLSKNKLQNLLKDLEKHKTLLFSYTEAHKNQDKVKEEYLISLKTLKEKENEKSILKEQEPTINNKIVFLSSAITKIENNSVNIKTKISDLKHSISKLEVIISQSKNRNTVILQEGTILKNESKRINIDISNLEINQDQIIKEEQELYKINDEITVIKSELLSLNSKEQELLLPLPEGSSCNHCRQKITKEHIKDCKEQIVIELVELRKEKEKNIKISEELNIKKKTHTNIISTLTANIKKSEELKSKLAIKNSEIENKREIYGEINSSINKNEEELKEKQNKLGILITEQNKNNYDELIHLNTQLSLKKKELSLLIDTKDQLTSLINNISSHKAVLEHQIEEININNKKIEDGKEIILKLEKNIIMHQKVADAFSSGGIPSFIINTILDDFQFEANEWINKFRPGLQVQFSVVKVKSDGEMVEDTLDIIYILDSYVREYKQLSGAQKLIVSLALKLALATVMKKRLGVDIRLLLLDEVDQSLDEGNIDVFSDIIKELQKDFKVLCITHNSGLKEKFNQAIVVEQNEDLVSSAKLVNIW